MKFENLKIQFGKNTFLICFFRVKIAFKMKYLSLKSN